MMMGFDDAIENIEKYFPEMECKPIVLNRLRYERDKARPVRPRFNKGIYGHKYDTYSCGQCGAVIAVTYKYCSICGYSIGWESPGSKIKEKEK